MRTKTVEQERTAEELVTELSRVRLELEEALEAAGATTLATWQDDHDVKTCQKCDAEFTISKRKVRWFVSRDLTSVAAGPVFYEISCRLKLQRINCFFTTLSVRSCYVCLLGFSSFDAGCRWTCFGESALKLKLV